MKLETTLIELSALVDYGSQYLIDRTEMANKNAFDLYNLTSLADFMEYADLDDFDLLDHIDKSTIIEHLSNTYSLDVDDVFTDDDITCYARDHYCLGDVYSCDDILDFARNNFDFETLVDLDDMVEIVKDCYSADEVYDMDVETILGNASLDDFLETHRDITDEEILSTISPESICEYIDTTYGADEFLETVDLSTLRNYISIHYDLIDFVDWF